MSADLILRNGRFTTLDRSSPTATAVAVTDGLFAAVGRETEVMGLAGPKTRIVDLGSSRVDLQACKLEYSIVSPK